MNPQGVGCFYLLVNFFASLITTQPVACFGAVETSLDSHIRQQVKARDVTALFEIRVKQLHDDAVLSLVSHGLRELYQPMCIPCVPNLAVRVEVDAILEAMLSESFPNSRDPIFAKLPLHVTSQRSSDLGKLRVEIECRPRDVEGIILTSGVDFTVKLDALVEALLAQIALEDG